ncbi:MAG: DoxX family membrane protein, partial [Anaerolineales bacterium]
MNTLFLIGRIMVGFFWLMNAYNHFAQAKMMVPYAQSKGVPMAGFMVPASGLLLVAGGLSILTGLYPSLGVL